jgi:hypothetical protein
MSNLQIYLAGRYSRREELCEYRIELQKLGFKVQSRWLDGEHQLSTEGVPIGKEGESLVERSLRPGEYLSEHEMSKRAAILRSKFATDDFEDVCNAQLIINFTEQPRSKANRGGRHVEFGIALANKSRVIVVGYREHIFHWLPQVEFVETWEKAKQLLK